MNLQAKFTELRKASVSALRVISQLESENAALKAELENFKEHMGVCDCPRCGAYPAVLAERDRLAKEVEALKKTSHIVTSDEGTSYCAQCEGYAKERDRLGEIAREYEYIIDRYKHVLEMIAAYNMEITDEVFQHFINSSRIALAVEKDEK